MSKREQSRIGAAAAIALYQIRRRLEAGEHPRDDGFFDNSGLRSEAEELFEGVLIKSKNEHQEKKVRILGNIFANVVFYWGLSAHNRLLTEFRNTGSVVQRKGWNLREPGNQLPAEKSTRMKRLIVQLLVEDIISASRASELLGQPLQELWQEVDKQHDKLPL